MTSPFNQPPQPSHAPVSHAPVSHAPGQNQYAHHPGQDFGQVQHSGSEIAMVSGPVTREKDDHSFILYLILGWLTGGIWDIIVMYQMTESVNRMCRRDGRRTMNYVLALLLTIITFGIYGLIWYHQFSERIGNETARRGLGRRISAGSYWGWGVLGLLIVVGPYIYKYKLMDAVNALAHDHNARPHV